MKVFVVDIAKCNGCYNCQIACKDEHVDNDWGSYAKPQPDTGQFWMKIHEKIHGQTPKVKIEYTPTPCMHCDNAPCITEDGAVYKRDDGLVIIDPTKAQNKKEIVDTCPYNKIYWNEFLQLPQKCTGCAHLLDEGGIPRCVDACATGALQFGEEEDFADLIAQAEVMQPELGLSPRVYYLNRFHNFVAGEVFDPIEDECIEEALVSLTCNKTNQTLETGTDCFGDFWLRKLPSGNYNIKIEKAGYKTYEEKNIKVEDSIKLEDVPLEKI
ncbi:MAG TPA: 4Fe-4S dicluster domain-containing protein [Syntrophomonadaceae bacterium]|nr:4Fe-4S dicluster domain-containing protein [Syntrophomonadaceae bacterium]